MRTTTPTWAVIAFWLVFIAAFVWCSSLNVQDIIHP